MGRAATTVRATGVRLSHAASLIALLAIAVLAGLCPNAARAADGDVLRREILALYDGSRHEAADATLVHRLAEMPLNHLGYVVRYRDVREALPDIASTQRYVAVLTWFEAPLAEATAYLDWASRAACAGTRFVIMGEVGGDPFSPQLRAVNRLLSCIGLQHAGQAAAMTLGAEAQIEDAGIVGFEIGLDPVLPAFPIVTTIPARSETGVRAALSVRPPAASRLQRSTLVATSRGGGYVASGYIYHHEVGADRLKWIIDPFAFFARALGREMMPVPDVTTISGRRLYFSHIDGDGWSDIVETAGYRDRNAIAAEVLEKELIAPFAAMPVTVGLVAGEVADAKQHVAREAARRILALPQVEIASHTYSLPRTWAPPNGNDRSGFGLLASRAWRALGGGGAGVPPDLNVEIGRAVAVTKSLAPSGKAVALYTWSGDKRPSAEAIRTTRAMGLRNLNGGGARLGSTYPSIAYVPPISRPVAGERQIYAVDYDEHRFSFAAHPSYSFQTLGKTIDATEHPRRLRGIHLNYSGHAAARTATTASLRRYLEAFNAMQVAPISASLYAAMADSFDDVEFIRSGARRWTVRNRGAIQTLRIDDADAVSIDWPRSQGAIGETRLNGSLYVALDAVVAEPAIALQDREAERAPSPPSLVDSRWQVSKVLAEPCRLRYSAQGYGEGAFVWTGIEPGRHQISVVRAGNTLLNVTAEATQLGQLSFTLAVTGIEPVDVTVACVQTRGS